MPRTRATPKQRPDDVKTTIYLPTVLHQRIVEEAARERRSVNATTVLWLERYHGQNGDER